MRKHEQPKKWTLLFVIVVLLVISQVVLYNKFFSSQSTIEDEDWSCVQVACSRLMTQGEIIKQFCYLSEEGQAVCDITFDGVDQTVPLDSLNISAIQVCAEQVCLAESLIREVNYTIEQNQ